MGLEESGSQGPLSSCVSHFWVRTYSSGAANARRGEHEGREHGQRAE